MPTCALQPELASLFLLRGVDVVAIRLWLSRKVSLPHVSNVVGGGVPSRLEDVGWTFYNLNELHEGLKDEEGTVIECGACDNTTSTNQLPPTISDAKHPQPSI